ncbi:MAG: TIGR03032 family protein [Saprospiraceae bacterium]|nr:TIGR03032 family protein [Saprospiraceae bacterium]MCF8248898.1 TIGR03032 family protein [Saprospiraceae bacterium]MCF8279623.1 TIGR03032 family protein [Bacteroidales bacterium]MCF8310183.1 TIGR03032 family protein [Saprospiraceae bacterium]MCF8439083.1 TIGR03032 family protein [Saprospiraceae bacterium]
MQTTVPPPFSCTYTPSLPELLRKLGCTIALSTFQAGKVIFLSAKNDDELTQLPRNFAKPMGIALHGNKMAVACLDEVIVLANSPELATHYPNKPGTYDALYMPRACYFTGQIDIHDLDYGANDQLFAINTSFSCIIKIDDNYSFTPIWKPKFISKLVSEDRCHLNGMALLNGQPKFVTAFHDTDTMQGWRERVVDGGIVIDVVSGEIIARDLPMPHSPRLFEGQLFLLLSATGQLVKLDENSGKKELVTQLNGFVRGLCRHGDYAFIGHSKLRKSSSTFAKLKFAENATMAGVSVIHLPTGALVAEIRYQTSVDEIYDVQVLPHCQRPGILNTQKPEYKLGLSTPVATYWATPKPE